MSLLNISVDNLLNQLPTDVIEKLVERVWYDSKYRDIRERLCKKTQVPAKIKQLNAIGLKIIHHNFFNNIPPTESNQTIIRKLRNPFNETIGKITFRTTDNGWYIPVLLQMDNEVDPLYNVIQVESLNILFEQKFVGGICGGCERYRYRLHLTNNRDNTHTLIGSNYEEGEMQWISNLPIRVKIC